MTNTMKITLKNVADLAGVSPTTVSLVLNNKPGVGEKTRAKILRIIEEMGYSNKYQAKPALQKEGNIKFIVYKKHGKVVSDTPFFSALIEGIVEGARIGSYKLNITYMNEGENNNDILHNLYQFPPDGIILLATEMESNDLHQFVNLKIPFVILDSNFKEKNFDTVIINNREGTYAAIKYLIDMGHKQIGYLHSSVWINNFSERKEGYLKALSDHNLKYNKSYLFMLESTTDGAYRDMSNLIQNISSLPSALFADNDIIAAGAIKALKEKGFLIPEDISIIGFDDMPLCEMLEPPLSTVKVFKKRMGMITVRRLLEMIKYQPPESLKIEVGTEVVKRGSVLKRI